MRTLLATIPAVAPTTSAPVNLSTSGQWCLNAQEDSPIVAVDPLNPQKIVAVWVNNDTPDIPTPGPQVFVEGEYSVNGGQTWASFPVPALVSGSIRTPPTRLFLICRSPIPSVSFDRNGNFYVLVDQHNGGGTSGALVLQKFAFTGDAPVVVRFHSQVAVSTGDNVIYQWLPAGDQAFEPTMAVDDNIASFTDPTTGQVQTDTSSGNVYIAWASGSSRRQRTVLAPCLILTRSRWSLRLMVDSNFSGPGKSSTPVALRPDHCDAMPSQRSRSAKGDWPVKVASRGTPGFQAVRSPSVGLTSQRTSIRLLVNSVSPGHDFRFNGSTGIINPGNRQSPDTGTLTDFPATVSIPANQIAALDSLSLTVDILDANDASLGLKLIAPGGESITLFTNQSRWWYQRHGPRNHRRKPRGQ